MNKNIANLEMTEVVHTHTHTNGYNLQIKFEKEFKLGLIYNKIE